MYPPGSITLADHDKPPLNYGDAKQWSWDPQSGPRHCGEMKAASKSVDPDPFQSEWSLFRHIILTLPASFPWSRPGLATPRHHFFPCIFPPSSKEAKPRHWRVRACAGRPRPQVSPRCDVPTVAQPWCHHPEPPPVPESQRSTLPFPAYYASVSQTDRNFGLVLDALEKQGLANNTIIVFIGDHGWQLGDLGGMCDGRRWQWWTLRDERLHGRGVGWCVSANGPVLVLCQSLAKRPTLSGKRGF